MVLEALHGPGHGVAARQIGQEPDAQRPVEPGPDDPPDRHTRLPLRLRFTLGDCTAPGQGRGKGASPAKGGSHAKARSSPRVFSALAEIREVLSQRH